MNFPFFIARRYVFSKKSTNAINVISAISVVGVAVGTMALVIVLSVFNGFHDLVASFFTNFDPQIELVPTQGKTAPADDPLLDKIRKMPQVSVHTDVLEDQGLAVYGDRQQMVTVMGVDENFTQLTNISDILYGDGEFSLQAANLFYAIPGIRLAQDMGLGARFEGYLKLYAPVRRGQITELADPSEGFVVDSLISPGVVFAVNQAKYDRDHIICSIGFARRLFDQDGMLSSLQIRLKAGHLLWSLLRDLAGGFACQPIRSRFSQSLQFNLPQSPVLRTVKICHRSILLFQELTNNDVDSVYQSLTFLSRYDHKLLRIQIH